MSTFQSNEEILRLMDEYSRVFAPPDLIQSQRNSQILLEHVINTYKIVAISYLIAGEKTLGASLDRKPKPRVLSESEIQAASAKKEEARMRKDYFDSIAPQQTLGIQETNQMRADAKKKEANEKEYKNLVSQIEYEISNYSVGHSSGIPDYARTESGRDSLRQVRDKYHRRNIEEARIALTAVRAAKNRL